MSSTLLSMVQDAANELGLKAPSSVVGSSNATSIQLLALFNRVGKQLYTEDDWQFLFQEHRFQTVFYQYTGDVTAGSTTISNLSSVTGLSTDFMVTGTGLMQDTWITSVGANSVTLNIPSSQTAAGVTFTFGQALYSVPSDYDRIVNKTEYNKTNRWSIIGPKSAQEWQWLKASYITTGPRMRFRIVDDKIALWPMPTSAVTLGFEYVSNAWVTGSDGTKFTSDSDTCKFPDNLMVMGAKMRFLEAKGLDSSAEASYFQRELSKFKAQNAGADTLSMAPRTAGMMITQSNIPDQNFGRVTG